MMGWRVNRTAWVTVQWAAPSQRGAEIRSAVPERRAYAKADDASLMRWSGTGDREAFDQIVIRHGPYALRAACRLTPDAQTAEDIVQEAFIRAWNNAQRFDSTRASFTTWLYRVIVNLSIDHARRKPIEPLPEGFEVIDDTPSAESQIAVSQQRQALVQALQSVPPRQRAALALVYDEGLSGAEAARRLGLSAKAVERLLARGRTLLRTLIDKHNNEQGGRKS